jgi:hypothetical protein
MLRQAPLTYGLPSGKNRILTVGPLTALYEVSEPDRLVKVLDYTYHG